MRSGLTQHARFVGGALALVCALVTGLHARPQEGPERRDDAKEPQRRVQERRDGPKEPERRAKEPDRAKEAQRPGEERRGSPKEPEQVPQQPNNAGPRNAPEIDGSMIPTALALAGAGVLLLRARLRSK